LGDGGRGWVGDGEGDGVGRTFTWVVTAAVSEAGRPVVVAPCAVADSVTWSPPRAAAGTVTWADSPDAWVLPVVSGPNAQYGVPAPLPPPQDVKTGTWTAGDAGLDDAVSRTLTWCALPPLAQTLIR
jgi:hypothetical protein